EGGGGGGAGEGVECLVGEAEVLGRGGVAGRVGVEGGAARDDERVGRDLVADDADVIIAARRGVQVGDIGRAVGGVLRPPRQHAAGGVQHLQGERAARHGG